VPELCPGAGAALKFQRTHAVVALEIGGAQNVHAPLAKDENGAISPELAHIPAIEIFRHHAIRRVGLHIDALDAAAIDEIVDEGSAPGAFSVLSTSAMETPSAVAFS
jgi:hypothetical protein